MVKDLGKRNLHIQFVGGNWYNHFGQQPGSPKGNYACIYSMTWQSCSSANMTERVTHRSIMGLVRGG